MRSRLEEATEQSGGASAAEWTGPRPGGGRSPRHTALVTVLAHPEAGGCGSLPCLYCPLGLSD